MQDCEAALGLIDGTGAYHHALAAIGRGKAVPPEDLKVLPVAFLDEGEEPITQEENLLLLRRLPITVEAWLTSSEGDLPTQANRLLADIERALTADPTRGGLATRTDVIAAGVTLDESPGVLGSARAQFTIEYRTLRGNPASKG